MSEETYSLAPVWQPDLGEWNIVPHVPYESYSEFEGYMCEFRIMYRAMVGRLIENSLRDSTMKPWSIGCFGFLGHIEKAFLRDGVHLFLGLTKGTGNEWCVLVNRILFCILNATAKTFFYYSVEASTDIWLDEYNEALLRVLDREICAFTDGNDIRVFGLYPFKRKNFKSYGYYGPLNSTGTGFDAYIPIGKFQDLMVAFSMVTHARLGDAHNCSANVLSNELVMFIFKWGVF